MNAIRRRRLTVTLFLVVGVACTLSVAIVALQRNMEFFYLPDQIVNGEVPRDTRIRAGGMVLKDSLIHDEESLSVRFVVSDLKGSEFPVQYSGLLPALFQEGQGTVISGTLGQDGVFHAETVLAKHDENYVPPELEALVHSRDP